MASEREVLVARGRSDGRTVILVPEVKANTTTGITLLHVRFHDRLDAATMRAVLVGYDRRYDRLVDWVTETEGAFDDRLLGELPGRRAAHRADLRRRRPLAALRAGVVIGIGVDVVEIERFRRSLARTPSMRERLFTPSSWRTSSRRSTRCRRWPPGSPPARP